MKDTHNTDDDATARPFVADFLIRDLGHETVLVPSTDEARAWIARFVVPEHGHVWSGGVVLDDDEAKVALACLEADGMIVISA